MFIIGQNVTVETWPGFSLQRLTSS